MASDTALSRIVEADGAPVGYAHAVEIGVWGAPRPEELPPATWDIDLFIASEAHRGRGAALRRLPCSLRKYSPRLLAVACCGFVSVRNEAAVRAYERAGFRWRRIWHDPLFGPAWLMLKERPMRHRPRLAAARRRPAAAIR